MWLTERLHKFLLPGYSMHTGHSCLHLAGVKSRLRLTSTDSEHTVMHSSYTNRRGVEMLLQIINTPPNCQRISAAIYVLQVSRSVLTTCSLNSYSKLSRSSYSSQAFLSLQSSPIISKTVLVLKRHCLCRKVVCRTKI